MVYAEELHASEVDKMLPQTLARLPPFVPSTIYLGTAHERKSRVSRYPFRALSGLDQMTLLSR